MTVAEYLPWNIPHVLQYKSTVIVLEQQQLITFHNGLI